MKAACRSLLRASACRFFSAVIAEPIFVGYREVMKTTIEIPDRLFREVKATAASRGESLRQFLTDALAERLRHVEAQSRRPWMRHYGALRDYSDELDRIERVVEEEFEKVDRRDWA